MKKVVSFDIYKIQFRYLCIFNVSRKCNDMLGHKEAHTICKFKLFTRLRPDERNVSVSTGA